MKTELKHLAAYYPYDLKVQYYDDERGNMTVCRISELREEECTINDSQNQWEVEFYEFMPILNPLINLDISALKIIYPNTPNFDFLVSTQNTKDYHFKNLSNSTVEYCIMQYCFENSFDVFGLIECKCAIDVNTLTVS